MNIVMSRRQFLSGLLTLNCFSRCSDIPQPSLQIGTICRYSWINDDRLDPVRFGQPQWITGPVTGMVWDGTDWLYHILTTASNEPLNISGTSEEYYADELEVLG